MKHLLFFGLIICAAAFVSCESTQTAGTGNQEQKRYAALQQARQKEQPDEAQQNLWSAQENTLNKDGNPNRGY
jgi:hypothetical protein